MKLPESYLTSLFFIYLSFGIIVGVAFTMLVPLLIPIPENLITAFAIMSVVAGILLGCLNYFVCKQFIRFCTEKFKKVLTQVRIGDYSARALYQGTDIIGAFTNALNHTIAELEEKDRISKQDLLTGLPNRFALEEYFRRLELIKEQQTLYFVDMDRFKSINDQYGHSAGDKVLQEVAVRLRQFDAKTQSRSYRYGGDEFVIISDSYSSEASLQEDLDKIFSDPVIVDGVSFPLSWSVGSQTFVPGTADIEEVLIQADSLMYVEKAKTR
ncbi:GGDEF domain-containing protein [Alkalicoccus daliensis]|uniref:Diguanylate cyclase (GGDEF) domain-containing protein n=1 Tax=Alkalicoccus daliensis TaxID=745820 RepID=A0A1H0DR09_9BACI|nr:GGDEF domain-containing protein [Alkalicoccus daliensis]SDN72677.1 diguanylate cyclase (GGDEF) domain-containing protein [Alkalicoccus daliensis]